MKQKAKILIVEDEALMAMKIEMQIEKLGHDLVAAVDNSKDALEIIDQKEIDLIIMDIHIQGDYDGIELVGLIKQKKDINILFVSSQQDDLSFKRAKRYNPVGFIIKPFSEIQLQRSIELALESTLMEKQSETIEENAHFDHNSFFIKDKNQFQKLSFEQIYYLESDGHYCKIYTDRGMFYIRKKMKEVLEKLPKDDFVQCHRSFIVNLKKVKTVDFDEDFIILEELKIPISRREKDNLLNRLNLL